jgi:two-component system CheB/CheR fusion protein
MCRDVVADRASPQWAGLVSGICDGVALSAYVGGTGPATLSVVLSAAAVTLVTVARHGQAASIAIGPLVLFAAVAVVMTLLIGRLRGSFERARLAQVRAERARDRAEGANQDKETFFALLSHEWRTPLNTMSAWLWQLERRAGDHDFVRRATAGLQQAVGTQARLASDLLDYSRGAHGKLSIEPARIRIADPVQRALDTIAADVARRQQTVTVFDQQADTVVWADAIRLEQLFTNLLQNATKFTPSEGTITVAFTRTNDWVQVSVTDTGVGMAREAQGRIFDPFTQSNERRDTRRGGLGLGLSIARDIAQLHGGSLTAWSAGPAMGSSFCVRLPRATAEHQQIANPLHREEAHR